MRVLSYSWISVFVILISQIVEKAHLVCDEFGLNLTYSLRYVVSESWLYYNGHRSTKTTGYSLTVIESAIGFIVVREKMFTRRMVWPKSSWQMVDRGVLLKLLSDDSIEECYRLGRSLGIPTLKSTIFFTGIVEHRLQRNMSVDQLLPTTWSDHFPSEIVVHST